ncbi:protein PBDC1-like [Corticium candelabrum]|uniref:protein PBDC1-like n=1 Tax=Corticium candelabrum TaxID=121492 RepID=UPI002E25F416|nr:protein PBDC1-like [Corticium candelabrum]
MATTGMREQLDSLGLASAASLPGGLCDDASKYVNDTSLEMQWAMKSWHYSEIHFKLISTVDPSTLQLTRLDDLIYRQFRKKFKRMKIDIINEGELKTDEAKARWRPFCKLFESVMDEYNFGTLLRLDASKGYTETNTILVTRIQFYAIEIARNRQGLNSSHYKPDSQSDDIQPV